MRISRRLLIIIALTVTEVSATLWAAIEISKGATFHQLNFLHLKYNAVYLEEIDRYKSGQPIDVLTLQRMIQDVRAQPVACLELVGVVDRFVMRQIGTLRALQLCEKDIADADQALLALRQYDLGELSKTSLIQQLEHAGEQFVANSSDFEEPVIRTVEFVFNLMIPLVILLSITNIISIAYLARAISMSIGRVIDMLNDRSRSVSLHDQIETELSGELQELLRAAQARIRSDLLARELNDRLEAQVQERTDSLQRANDELAQFAYRASHDLKAPLTSAKGLAQLIGLDIEQGNLPEATQNAQRIAQQMVGLERLVVDILELAKADLAEEQQELVDIAQVVAEVSQRYRRLCDEHGVSLRVHVPADSSVMSSRTRFTQIIDNLISNGIKYHHPQREHRFVRISWRPGPAELVIEDNGIGVSEEHKPKLFDMFERFHPDRAEGTGLGLSIVKRHVERMGGALGVDSSSAGTRFAIVFGQQAAHSS